MTTGQLVNPRCARLKAATEEKEGSESGEEGEYILVVGQRWKRECVAIPMHRTLGPGLLEAAYSRCLEYEIASRGMSVRREEPIALVYGALQLDNAYRPDLVVEGKVLVEVKSVVKLLPVHDAQVLTYLRLRGLAVGLILNFHGTRLREGIRRLVL
jgi:GxxExxY protein